MITLYWYTNAEAAVLTATSRRLTIVELADVVAKPVFKAAPAATAHPTLGLRDAAAASTYKRRVSLDVEVDDTSNRYRQLMQKPVLTLKFSLPEYIDFPVGTWCVFQNQTYTLNSEKNLTKNGKRNITYNMTLGGDEDNLALYKMRNSVDGRLKYSMCAKPHELIDEVVKNLNAREGKDVWSVGACIESTEKTVEFNHAYIDAALQTIADTFETEWEIVDHVISLHKVEYFKDDPLPLSYGRGNGFVPGLGRTTATDQAPIKRIYTQGGIRNIDRSKYGGEDSQFPEYETTSAELRLPPSQTLEYEGRTYKTDAQGYYVERTDKVSTAVKEDSLDCSEIYPSRVGKVGAVVAINEAKHFYDIIDTAIPSTLNYNNYLIGGENPTIIFQSGMLSGKEFEFKYKHEERRFEIVPQEIDGIIMPDPATGFMPKENDEYAIFGIMLPKEYFFNNADKTGASWDMFREAAKKLYENEDPKFTFKGELQGLWAKNNWLRVGGHLIVGGYILFSDEQFAKEGIAIRITGIKDYVNNPYAPTLEISNSVSGSTVRTDILKIENTEVVVDDTKQEIIQYTKRRFRDAMQTLGMLEDARLDDYSGAIAPITVRTMAMLVGDESLQYIMGKTLDTLGSGDYQITFNNTTKMLEAPAGYLRHMTIGQTDITGAERREASSYKTWPIKAPALATFAEKGRKYYIYIEVNADDTTQQGEIFASETAVGMHDKAGYYTLLAGILNSEVDGERSFVTLYGFSEILPGRITTDRIISNDGQTYFDLVKGEIGGVLKFLSANNTWETIIDGGKIRSELIEVANLIAKKVIVTELDGTDEQALMKGQRVQIIPENKAVEIYDTNGDLCSIFEGNEYAAIDNLFGNSSGDITFVTRSGAVHGGNSGLQYTRGNIRIEATSDTTVGNDYTTVPISDKWYTDTPTEVKLTNGFVQCYAHANGYKKPSGSSGLINMQPYANSMAMGVFTLAVRTYEDEACTKPVKTDYILNLQASAMAGAKYNPTGSSDDWVEGESSTNYIQVNPSTGVFPKVKVPAGWHRLEMTYSLRACKSGSWARVEWGDAFSGDKPNLTASYFADFYVSRFFANGFCLGTSKQNYVLVTKSESNGMSMMLENNGNKLKFDQNGLQVGKSDGSWKSLM